MLNGYGKAVATANEVVIADLNRDAVIAAVRVDMAAADSAATAIQGDRSGFDSAITPVNRGRMGGIRARVDKSRWTQSYRVSFVIRYLVPLGDQFWCQILKHRYRKAVATANEVIIADRNRDAVIAAVRVDMAAVDSAATGILGDRSGFDGAITPVNRGGMCGARVRIDKRRWVQVNCCSHSLVSTRINGRYVDGH